MRAEDPTCDADPQVPVPKFPQQFLLTNTHPDLDGPSLETKKQDEQGEGWTRKRVD